MDNVIKVPKPGLSGFNPNRPLEKNHLVQAMVKHFHEAEMRLPKKLRTQVNAASIATEGEASEYIRQVTRAIHQRGGRAPKVKRAR